MDDRPFCGLLHVLMNYTWFCHHFYDLYMNCQVVLLHFYNLYMNYPIGFSTFL